MGACTSLPTPELSELDYIDTNLELDDPTIHDFIVIDCKDVYSPGLLTNHLFMKWQKEFDLENMILFAYDVVDTPPKTITKETFAVFNDLYEVYQHWFHTYSTEHVNYFTIKRNYIALATLKYYLNYLCIKINRCHNHDDFTEEYFMSIEKRTKKLKRVIQSARARY